MKKTLLTALVGLIVQFGFSQTTATDFTVNDCATASHTLFTELDAGKVIVMTWVMPCGACISVAGTVSSTVQGYSSSNPGRVKFYLVDDYANTTCSTLNSWASTNSIATDASFSNAAINMNDYGQTGMQMTVVLGGANHTVFFNQTGAVTAGALQTAINNALAATGISENSNAIMSMNLFPNPSVNDAKISYTLKSSANVSIEVLNILGEKINSISLGTQAAGKQEYQINVESLTEGIYFIKLNAGEVVETSKLTVTK